MVYTAQGKAAFFNVLAKYSLTQSVDDADSIDSFQLDNEELRFWIVGSQVRDVEETAIGKSTAVVEIHSSHESGAYNGLRYTVPPERFAQRQVQQEGWCRESNNKMMYRN